MSEPSELTHCIKKILGELFRFSWELPGPHAPFGISKRRETMAETIMESDRFSSATKVGVVPDPGVETEPPTAAAFGRVGYYPGNRCVLFSFPKRIGTYLPRPPKKLAVSPIGLDTWIIHPGEGKGCLREKDGLNVVQVSGRIAAPNLTFFTSTPAEYVAANDHVTVRLMQPPPVREDFARPAPALAPMTSVLEVPIEAGCSVLEAPTDAECRAALEAVRRIYAATPYRLVEGPDGKIFWMAVIE